MALLALVLFHHTT